MDATDSLATAGVTAHPIYGLVWTGFGGLHALLAREIVKRRLRPLFGAGYRDDRARVPALIPWRGRAVD